MRVPLIAPEFPAFAGPPTVAGLGLRWRTLLGVETGGQDTVCALTGRAWLTAGVPVDAPCRSG